MAVEDGGPVRLGLIGTGLAVEKLHWPALRLLAERFAVTAFADPVAERGRRFARYSGIDEDRYCPDAGELLARDDVDAVLISVPIPQLHAAARAALAAGKHVLCEKPTGVDEAQAHAFLALAAAHPDRTFMVGENFFYRDDLRHARTLLDAGAIGPLRLMTWRRVGQLVPREGSFTSTPWRHRPQYRGGAHLDAGVHHVAQIRMLCGEVAQVHGLTQEANATIDGPSDLVLNLAFANGGIGNYTASYAEAPVPAEPNEMRLHGAAGTLVLGGDATERTVELTRADGSVDIAVFRGIDNGYYAELCNFADAVQHGEPLVGTVAQSVANMMIVLRALDSAEQQSITFPEPVSGGGRVSLWRPRGGSGLFDGLPGEHRTASRSSAA